MGLLDILGGLVVILVSAIGWFFKEKMKHIKEDIAELNEKDEARDKKINEVQFNYLNRFEEVKDLISGNHIKTLEAINSIKVSIASSAPKTRMKFKK